MQISQIPLILTIEKKTNDILTIKLPFCYYTVKLIECMIFPNLILPSSLSTNIKKIGGPPKIVDSCTILSILILRK